MKTKRVGLSTPLPSASSSPPREFRIWPYGKIETTKGTFLFDKKAASSVMTLWNDYGNRLTFDYEHKAIDPNRRAGDGKSAGSALLQLRNDGLWAIDVRWSTEAAQGLAKKEWLYFSPYFTAEEKTGRILEIVNLALTNVPATKRMTPLIAADRLRTHSASRKGHSDMTLKQKLAAARAEYEAAKDGLIEVLADDGDGVSADDVAADAEAMAKAKAGAKAKAKARMMKAKAEFEAAKKSCEALDDGDGDADDAPPVGTDDDGDAPPAATDDVDADAVDTDQDGGGAFTDDVSTDAKKAPVPKSAMRVFSAAMEATGKKNPSEIVGALRALAASKSVGDATAREVAAMKTQLRRKDVEEMVKSAVKAGKITPKQKAWALDYGMKDPKALKAFIESAPVIAQTGMPRFAPSSKLTDAVESGVRLTNIDHKLAKELGQASGPGAYSIDDFAKTRVRQEATARSHADAEAAWAEEN